MIVFLLTLCVNAGKKGTGGGILVPIFINAIPVPLAQDAYPIAIAASFALHSFFPILKDVLACSPIFQVNHPNAIVLLDFFQQFFFNTHNAFLFGTFTHCVADFVHSAIMHTNYTNLISTTGCSHFPL